MADIYHERKQAGVCVRCGKRDERIEAGKVHCTSCSEKYMEEQRKRRNFMQMQGRCVHCGMEDKRTKEGYTVCWRCAKKIRTYPSTKAYQELYAKKQSAERAERKADHLCTACGGPLDEEGYVMCSGCRKYHRDYKKSMRERGGE